MEGSKDLFQHFWGHFPRKNYVVKETGKALVPVGPALFVHLGHTNVITLKLFDFDRPLFANPWPDFKVQGTSG